MQNNQKKVYALLVEFGETSFLSVQLATCLEDAFVMAKFEFEKQNLSKLGIGSPLIGAKIGLFTIKTVKELTENDIKKSIQEMRSKLDIEKKSLEKAFDEFAKRDTIMQPVKDLPIKKESESPAEEKNRLMKQIIDKKDKNLFEISKSLFSKNECRYIEEHIK